MQRNSEWVLNGSASNRQPRIAFWLTGSATSRLRRLHHRSCGCVPMRATKIGAHRARMHPGRRSVRGVSGARRSTSESSNLRSRRLRSRHRARAPSKCPSPAACDPSGRRWRRWHSSSEARDQDPYTALRRSIGTRRGPSLRLFHRFASRSCSEVSRAFSEGVHPSRPHRRTRFGRHSARSRRQREIA